MIWKHSIWTCKLAGYAQKPNLETSPKRTIPAPKRNVTVQIPSQLVRRIQVFEIANQRVKGTNQLNNSNEDSLMDIENQDPFQAFIDHARSVLSPVEGDEDEEIYDPSTNGSESTGPGWSWIASRILKTCIAYSSGVTSAILLSDLSQVIIRVPFNKLLLYCFRYLRVLLIIIMWSICFEGVERATAERRIEEETGNHQSFKEETQEK